MKIHNILILLMIVANTLSCREETPSYQQTTDSKDGVLIYLNNQNRDLPLTIYPLQDTRSYKLSAGYGGLGLPASDINVSIAVDQKAFDSINQARKVLGETPYELFPNNSYSFDKTTATIKAGTIDSDYMTMSYYPRVFNKNKNYILPVSLVNASGYKISNAKTIVFRVPVFIPPFTALDRSTWTATANSEQATGENTGKAPAALDGNINTIWHTEYSPKKPTFPHWLEVDMKASTWIGQIGLIKRQNNNQGPNSFYVEGSNDRTTWTKLLDKSDMDPTNNNEQKYRLTTSGKYRYLKVTFVSGVNHYAFLAELNVYTTAPEYQN